MAVIRDVMASFELYQPSSVADAQKLLEQHGSDAWVLAGGLDSFDWLKDRIRKPKAVVDLSGIEELRGVRTTADGIEIGAMTTLTEIVANDPIIKQKYTICWRRPRNWWPRRKFATKGTLGGNVSQDTRCWYYRGGWPCYRAGGNICYADTPEGRNREHAILHADRCVAVNPSDSAPALIALDAKFVHAHLQTGERVVDAEDYFIGPDIDITRLHILQPGDLLTAIRIPSTWAGAQFYFEKDARPKRLGLPAAERRLSHGAFWRYDRPHPNCRQWRGRAASTLRDSRRSRARKAAQHGDSRGMPGKLAVQGAVPLQFNAYKIPLMRNLVKRAIVVDRMEEATWAS
jgi:xanthine dehydrogenase YagS FAD-binding subunit